MDDIARWIALARAAESLPLGPLLRAAGSLDALLGRILGVGPDPEGAPPLSSRVRAALGGARPGREDEVSAGIAARCGIRALPFGSPEYPESLARTHDPPAVLFTRGPGLSAAPVDRVAIVGARACTARGERVARALGAALSSAGVVVVSGLARGIDAAGHDGALRGPGGTWAVLAGGLDRPSPACNAALFDAIVEGGLAFAEVPPGTPPEPFRFPRRNRIIAGLARAVIVVEAEERSGALITARLAAEEGRDVLAVPGPVDSALSRGPHRLIRAGAGLVEDAGDLLESLGLARDDGGPAAGKDEVGRWFRNGPAGVDALLSRSGLPPGILQERLLMLEIEGRITRAPTGEYRPLARKWGSPIQNPEGGTRMGARSAGTQVAADRGRSG
ncbi:DNA-processing protein DprA [Myxococcota bacterium]|nr:DNA-processing protein DprA [Myxococcota bacterium]